MTALSTANDTAGTCGRGYLLDPAPHAWAAANVDPGQRPRCTCGSENRAGHPPTPRTRSEK